MEILIPLPVNVSANTYKELRGYLKQLELAVHHAQKAVDNAEETGIEISDSCFVCFEHPALKNTKTEASEDFAGDYYDELQDITLRINFS